MSRLREKTTAILLIAIFMMSMFSMLPATIAATEDEIEDAIESGIDWLASQQNIDGSWGGDSEAIGTTGLVLIKLQDLAYELDFESPFDPAYPYSDNVIHGWEYLFSVDGDDNPLNAISQTLSTQTAGDPDTNNNGIGIRFGTVDYRMTYSTGICLMAIESSGTPGRLCGIDFDGDNNIDSFFDVAQDAADWLAYGQVDSGMCEGGWGYDAVDNDEVPWPDNSNGGYAVLGLAAAEGMGCTVPDWVKTELDLYIDFIQNDQGTGDDNGEFLPDGGSGYVTPDYWVNSLKTGNLIFQMTFAGDAASTTRFQHAMEYIVRHWQDTGGGTWDTGWGYNTNPANYQAMYCLMKGLEYSGIDLIDLDVDSVPEHDWYEEFAQVLVDQQSDNGYWIDDSWGSDIVDTCWALLTLEKVTPPPPKITVNIDIKPGSWPNPFNKKAKGVFALAICGTEDFDVTQIDPETIMIYHDDPETGVPPLRWTYEDAATPYDDMTPEEPDGHDLEGDGILDLVLHFDRREVTPLLCNYNTGDYVELYITGNLLEEFGGTAISGFDWVRIKK